MPIRLDDRDARAQQRGVHGPLPVVGVVDVERVDPDECRAGFADYIDRFL